MIKILILLMALEFIFGRTLKGKLHGFVPRYNLRITIWF